MKWTLKLHEQYSARLAGSNGNMTIITMKCSVLHRGIRTDAQKHIPNVAHVYSIVMLKSDSLSPSVISAFHVTVTILSIKTTVRMPQTNFPVLSRWEVWEHMNGSRIRSRFHGTTIKPLRYFTPWKHLTYDCRTSVHVHRSINTIKTNGLCIVLHVYKRNITNYLILRRWTVWKQINGGLIYLLSNGTPISPLLDYSPGQHLDWYFWTFVQGLRCTYTMLQVAPCI